MSGNPNERRDERQMERGDRQQDRQQAQQQGGGATSTPESQGQIRAGSKRAKEESQRQGEDKEKAEAQLKGGPGSAGGEVGVGQYPYTNPPPFEHRRFLEDPRPAGDATEQQILQGRGYPPPEPGYEPVDRMWNPERYEDQKNLKKPPEAEQPTPEEANATSGGVGKMHPAFANTQIAGDPSAEQEKKQQDDENKRAHEAEEQRLEEEWRRYNEWKASQEGQQQQEGAQQGQR